MGYKAKKTMTTWPGHNKNLPTPCKSEWLQWIELDLLYLDDCQVECNGMSWAVSYLLDQASIKHECMLGYVMSDNTGEAVTPHYWVTLPGGWIIDFRLRMWLGNTDDVPHGVFHTNETSWLGMRYEGSPLQRSGMEFSREFVMDLTSDLVSHVQLMSQPNNTPGWYF